MAVFGLVCFMFVLVLVMRLAIQLFSHFSQSFFSYHLSEFVFTTVQAMINLDLLIGGVEEIRNNRGGMH